MSENDSDYVHIDVDSGSSIFIYILKYGASFDTIKNYTTDFIKHKKYEENPKNKYKVELRLPYGISKINYKDIEIIINYFKDSNTVGLSHSAKRYESINIKTKSNFVIQNIQIML